MSDKVKYEIWDILARLGAVLPPLGATLYFFPEWIQKSSGATFSGMLVVAGLVFMVPFWRKIFGSLKKFTLTNASMPIFWIVFCGVFFALQDIVYRMLYIGVAGFLGSLLSFAICIKRNQYRTRVAEVNVENRKDE